jgi:putative methionine-R-sulfoxide reductase with GAF domain
MNSEEPFERLADEIIDELEQQIAAPLNEIYEQLGPGQLFIQFIDHRSPGSDDVPLRRPRQKLWKAIGGFTVATFRPESIKERPMGLTRWVPLNNVVIVYPTDSVASVEYFEADPRVATELVGPIHCKGKVTGVVLADRIDQSRIYNQEETALFTGFLHRIDQEILKATLKVERRKTEEHAKYQLTNIANHCYSETLSARGYIAVKRWDGLLEYFTVGEGKEMFLDLAPHEGLCGKVFRTGLLENPKQSLLKDGNYIPSDSDINSEIVFPIKSNGETIGVINLESYAPDAYDEKVVELLAGEAENAVVHAEIFTKPPDPEFGYAIADLFKSSLGVRPPPLPEEFGEEIRSTLERWALKLLHGRRCEYWLSRHNAQPPLLRGLTWEDAVLGTPTGSPYDTNKILYAPLLLQGEPFLVIALELEHEPRPQEVKTLKALCRIASEAFRRARYEYRVRCFINLMGTLISRDCSEMLINQVVQDVPFLLQSNHCSLFYYLRHNESVLFAVGPSTAKQVHMKGHNSGYLPLMSDGLTGFVAATGVPLRILNVRDEKELSGIHPELAWKSLVSEEIEIDCRSYLAVPIFDLQEPEKVIGVLRTHRDSKSHRSGFSDEDVGMFKALAYLLGKSLSIFLDKKTLVNPEHPPCQGLEANV